MIGICYIGNLNKGCMFQDYRQFQDFIDEVLKRFGKS